MKSLDPRGIFLSLMVHKKSKQMRMGGCLICQSHLFRLPPQMLGSAMNDNEPARLELGTHSLIAEDIKDSVGLY